ncbi:MAG: hypothetical protein P0Y49_00375 [Candidatus Pedobacter colombiensis]|uniref:DUF7033 domain-containing protein n=1 Tax=Candidatus Pedobacter colombiensis TaxID=3121371 RepID=A0AAJ6B774_9SPHI|nr:hypothetical protein [Pedobacter sp.]WEK19609.1 MAG: hypothetical protein P0Y49_00375 [Pedobacter sp.]
MKLLVYVPQLSPRIKYIFSFIFNDILKTEVGFTLKPEEFIQSKLPKLSYAPKPIGDELFFKSTSLLLDHKITDQQIKTTTFGEQKVPFPVQGSTLPFDVFAAAFYFLSRYEEYLPSSPHPHKLFPAETSLQYQLGILKLPIIDGWALILKNILAKHFPSLLFGDKHFSFNPIYSIHQAPKPKDKNIISNTITYIRTFIDRTRTKKKERLADIGRLIADMEQYGFVQNSRFFIPQKNEHHFEPNIQIPKSYVKLTKHKARNDYSMHYPNYSGFRAGTCTPFYWYDLQLDTNTQLLLHPVAATDITLLSNKTREDLLLQINELIDSVKLVNGNFYFLSLCNDIRPQ